MINQQTLEGHWNEIKGALKEHWGALTSDDLRRFSGDVDQLVGTIQRRTGETREAVQRFLEELTAEGSSIAANVVETARGLANRAAESAHDGYEHVVDQFRDRYADAEELVRTRPAESIAVSFGAGLLAGLVLGLVLRLRDSETPRQLPVDGTIVYGPRSSHSRSNAMVRKERSLTNDHHNTRPREAQRGRGVALAASKPADDLLGHAKEYARRRPEVVALWCFGIGFALGWKLKPW